MGYFKEEIIWIIDNVKDDYKTNIDFVHSFNLKCDCVGWCKMKFENEDDFKLLELIKEAAEKEKYKIRFCYNRYEYDYDDAQWYIIEPQRKCDSQCWEGIKGYKLPAKTHVAMADYVLVSQEFIDFCNDNKFTGLNFEYVGDVGKYKSKEYFAILPTEYVKRGIVFSNCIYDVSKSKRKKFYKAIDLFGGNLERIASGLHKLQFVHIPLKLTKEDEPQTDFCYITNGGRFEDVLVRKNVAEKLIANGFLKKTELIPVRYCDEKEHNILISEFHERVGIESKYIHEWKIRREKNKKKNRPEFIPSEKEGLRQLRAKKRGFSEDFNRPLSKKKAEEIQDNLAAIIPFFRVTNGCYINDDINMLPYEDIFEATNEFRDDIKDEEVAIENLRLNNCICIGQSMDGDRVVLREDNSVVIYNHEDFTLSNEYESIWSFVMDVI